MVATHLIVANRQQPRSVFNDEKIAELASSIKQSGIIQPLIVSQSADNRYELIAGERRLRAARKLGLLEVPVVIRHGVDEETLLELAIVENLQREDLNPIEEAKAFQSMIDQFDYSQDEVAKRVGRSRPAVANSLRLLQLPKVVQEDLVQGRMSTGHARALLGLPDLQAQLTVREQILRAQLTVRAVEKMVQARTGDMTKSKKASPDEKLSPQLRYLLEEMTKVLGTKVTLNPKSPKSGALIIEYYSLQDLDRIYRRVAAT